MNTNKDFQILLEAFMRMVNQLNASNKMISDYGTGIDLYPSEIHTIEAIGMNEGINVTELSNLLGVTKGAVSQIIRKLEKKDLIKRFKSDDNNQQVLLRLTRKGRTAFKGHAQLHLKQYTALKNKIDTMTQERRDFLLDTFNTIEKSIAEIE